MQRSERSKSQVLYNFLFILCHSHIRYFKNKCGNVVIYLENCVTVSK
jgi:hypothetical protein